MSTLQYTIRNIPEPVDRAMRKRAKLSGKSFNQTVVDTLTAATVGSSGKGTKETFDWMFNTGTLDDDFEEAIGDMSRIDPELWK